VICAGSCTAAAIPVDAALAAAVLIAPYDLREMAMLRDAGANAFDALLGLPSVSRFTGGRRWLAIRALAALTSSGGRGSSGASIERTPVLRELDEWERA
jgi:hypothetical protein